MTVFIFASDIEKSVTFYEALGFGPAVRMEGGLALIVLGDTGVMVSQAKDDASPVNDRVAISLELEAGEDLDDYRETCRARGLNVSEILQEWFGRIFWLSDPDGVTVQINAID